MSTCGPQDIPEIGPAEVLLMNEKGQSVFMSHYDRFTTLFFSKKSSMEEEIEKRGWEAVICGKDTKPDWFLE